MFITVGNRNVAMFITMPVMRCNSSEYTRWQVVLLEGPLQLCSYKIAKALQ